MKSLSIRWAAGLIAVMGVCVVAPTLAGAATSSFSNTAPISINDSTGVCSPFAATPYPSTISVSGLGQVSDVNVTLTGFSHGYPDDVSVLLVGPHDQSTILMSRTGFDHSVSGANLTVDDAATGSLPDDGQIVSGTYKPTIGSSANGCTESAFPTPAPAPPYGSSLSVFNGTDPNGTWSLYVVDEYVFQAGSISGGWSLDITTKTPADEIADLQATVSGLGLAKGLTTALNSKLNDALAALNANDTAGTCASLQAFLNQVKAQSGKGLTTAQATQLTNAANQIRTDVAC